MRRAAGLLAVLLCLAGCFVFDNPFDTQSRAAITFQIVVNSPSYGGTYVWNEVDAAYESVGGGTLYYIYMDANGVWCLSDLLNQTYASSFVIAHSVSPNFRALPGPSGWNGVVTSVDVSGGGISPQLKPTDSTVSVGDSLQAAFASTIPGVGALYQWLGSGNAGITGWASLGTGSTYHILDATNPWIRVIITPTDGAGNIIGPAVTSPTVRLSP